MLKFKNIEKRIKEEQAFREVKWHRDFYDCIKDIAEHPVVLRMKLYPHHGNTNCYEHCMNVAYYNYKLCRFLQLDARAAARGGMLHDLFLYDWHTHARKTGDHFHGLTHPKKAYQNARKFFELNHIEKDIMLTHMWPLTFFRIPQTKEGWIATLTDKYCGALETGNRKNRGKTSQDVEKSQVLSVFRGKSHIFLKTRDKIR